MQANLGVSLYLADDARSNNDSLRANTELIDNPQSCEENQGVKSSYELNLKFTNAQQ